MVVPAAGRGVGRGRGRGRVYEKSSASTESPMPGALPSDFHIGQTEPMPGSANARPPMSPGRGRVGGPKYKGSPKPRHNVLPQGQSNAEPLKDYQICTRPGYGEKGKKVRLITNFFLLSIPKGITLFRYEVDITMKRFREKKFICISGGKGNKMEREEFRNYCFRVLRMVEVKNPSVFRNPFGIIYDRARTLFSMEQLPIEKGARFTVQEEDGSANYFFKIRPVQEGEMTQGRVMNPAVTLDDVGDALVPSLKGRNFEALSILDMVFNQLMYYKHMMFNDAFVPLGHSFFRPGDDTVDLGGGRLLYVGFYKHHRVISSTAGQWKKPRDYAVAINVDMATTVMYKPQNVVDYLCEALNLRDYPKKLDRYQCYEFEKEIRHLFVNANHRNFRFSVDFLSNKPASQLSFKNRNGDQLTVAKYFEQLGYPLRFPDLPCLVKRMPRGIPSQNIPMELCDIVPNQRVPKERIKGDQTAAMIKYSAVKPERRRQATLDLLAESQQTPVKAKFGGKDPFSETLGIERDPQMMAIEGRVLQSPKIEYRVDHPDPDFRKNAVIPQQGQWEMGQEQQFLVPVCIQQYAIVTFVDMPIKVYEGFDNGMRDMCRQKGMQFPDAPVEFRGTRFHSVGGKGMPDTERVKMVESHLMQLASEFPKLDLIYCVIPKSANTLYGKIKGVSERMADIMTQCVVMKSAQLVAENYFNDRDPKSRKAARVLAFGLAMKINVKLAGVNLKLADDNPIVKKFLASPTMFVGADVTHPPALSKKEIALGVEPKEPSIAAVVGSRDNYPSQYFTAVRAQDPREEMIQDMKGITIQLLKAYKETTQTLPIRILFYRDGVAEGQYLKVMNKELEGVRNGCLAFGGPEYQPGITMIIVTKRHKVRLYKDEVVNERAPTHVHNVEAGTVVDRGPVHPSDFEFILASHQGIQGTSKASKYTVLHDDNDFDADDLQQLTFYLCHCYLRCTKPVSLPAPVYFAHHAAKRAKDKFQADIGSSDGDSSGYSSNTDGRFNADEFQRKFEVGEKTASRDYFL